MSVECESSSIALVRGPTPMTVWTLTGLSGLQRKKKKLGEEIRGWSRENWREGEVNLIECDHPL